jgi:hypothetical protein
VLKLYDVLGREVAALVDERQDAGYKTIQWNAVGLASGVYYYTLKAMPTDGSANVFVETRKVVVLR